MGVEDQNNPLKGMREKDIRPLELNVGKIKAFHTDLERLINWKSHFVTVACPSCNSEAGVTVFEKYGFNFDQCPHCRTVYMNPRAPKEILSRFYAQSALYDYWNRYIFPASRFVRKKRIFRPRVRRIIDLLIADNVIMPSTLVEIGSGCGMFCEEALATGAFNRVIGIEPCASLAATCRANGIEVIESTLDNSVSIDVKADVIATFETIEHVHSPEQFLRSCCSFLKPGGILALTCPNYEGFDITLLGPLSESLDAEHINMFNPDSLCDLLNREGFDIVECTTPGELDAEIVRNKVLKKEICLDDQPFLRSVLVENWNRCGTSFQRFLQDARMSSHMWIVARLRG